MPIRYSVVERSRNNQKMAESLDFAFDGGEEPLFADDLDDFGDDINNLPPQMPSLSELSADQARATATRGLGVSQF